MQYQKKSLTPELRDAYQRQLMPLHHKIFERNVTLTEPEADRLERIIGELQDQYHPRSAARLLTYAYDISEVNAIRLSRLSERQLDWEYAKLVKDAKRRLSPNERQKIQARIFEIEEIYQATH